MFRIMIFVGVLAACFCFTNQASAQILEHNDVKIAAYLPPDGGGATGFGGSRNSAGDDAYANFVQYVQDTFVFGYEFVHPDRVVLHIFPTLYDVVEIEPGFFRATLVEVDVIYVYTGLRR